MDKNNSTVQTPLSFPEQVFGIDFHPSADIVAAGLINGAIELHQYMMQDMNENNGIIFKSTPHTDSCRSVIFSADGRELLSGSKDCSIVASDSSNGDQKWLQSEAHSAPINCLYMLHENTFASGDDEGAVKLWDIRQKEMTKSFKYNKDFISDMLVHETDTNNLLITGGDGRLSVVDTRNGKLVGQSEEGEDELLSLAVVKHGKKVVCGSQDGDLLIFTWGQWSAYSDKFPGHPQSIDTLLKVDEQTICSGSSDGLLRVINILPNKLLGVIGDHDGFPVESIKFSRDRNLIGSVSHDSKIRFFSTAVLFDDDGDDDDDGKKGEDGVQEAKEASSGALAEKNTQKESENKSTKDTAAVERSDDDSDSSDDDDAMDSSKGPKRLKTDAEIFFADL
mmetsp:Transcript_3626/g.5089  ORF Transcript_3626/g.5089 Transcript_3626/m.5089 type:complete len:393 (+) Transcript_3626:13-1191(+)